MPTDAERAALRQAITAHATARAQRDLAQERLIRADAGLTALAEEARRCAEACEAAEARHAEGIAAAIRKGAARLNITIAGTIREAQAAVAEVALRQRMGQSARDVLAGEAQHAEAALAEAEATLRAASRRVASAEANILADELEQLRPRVAELERCLDGFANAIRPDPTPAAVWAALQPPSPGGENLGLHGARAVAGRKWAGYLRNLTEDADALFEDVPPEPRPTPTRGSPEWYARQPLAVAE